MRPGSDAAIVRLAGTEKAIAMTVDCNSRLWRDKLGQISLSTTTLFWGVAGNLRYIVLAWAAAALGYSTTQASALVGVVAIGTGIGAVAASMWMKLDRATTVIPLGIAMGLTVLLMNFISTPLIAAPFLIILGALGGPLAYFGGSGFSALSFPNGTAVGLVSVGVTWGVAMIVMVKMWRRQQPVTP